LARWPFDEFFEHRATDWSRPPISGGPGTSQGEGGRRIPGPTSVPWRRAKMTMTAIQNASSARITSDDLRCRRSQFIVVLRYDQLASGISYGDPYFSQQPTSNLLVTPLVTTTGPVARQTPVPPS